jgi:hypothetical protein
MKQSAKGFETVQTVESSEALGWIEQQLFALFSLSDSEIIVTTRTFLLTGDLSSSKRSESIQNPSKDNGQKHVLYANGMKVQMSNHQK